MALKIHCCFPPEAKSASILELYSLLNEHFQMVHSPQAAYEDADTVIAQFTHSIIGDQLVGLINNLREKFSDNPILVFGPGVSIETRLRLMDSAILAYLEYYRDDYDLIERLKLIERDMQDQVRSFYEIGDLRLYPYTREVKRSREAIKLRNKEFELLHYLCIHAHTPVSQTVLLENVWGYHNCAVTKTVHTHISSLRKKIDEEHEQKLLHTFSGRGYMLSDQIVPYESKKKD